MPRPTAVALFTAILFAGAPPMALADDDAKPADQDHRNPPVEFNGVKGWLNTEKPLRLADLRGHVVILDFWTYCCINCLHVLPDLKYLEEKYKDKPLVVIGVHSGKFDHEKDIENIRQAVLRHKIEHPVAVDSDFTVWRTFGVRAWPTMVVIDPTGAVVAFPNRRGDVDHRISGEGNRAVLDKIVEILLDEHGKGGTLADKPMRFKLEADTFEPGTLQFPGKVLADPANERLFIADTGHNRVLQTDLNGKIQRTFGDGKPGLKDGSASEARFTEPQGMALSEDRKTLYVADRENHALRAISLADGKVSTLAGDGEQGHNRQVSGPAKAARLNSPWALELVGEKLFIASAGTHQIWVLDLPSGEISVASGDGSERHQNGPADEAAFAQPSGFASDGKTLWIADSESSSVRAINVKTGEASTTAGADPSKPRDLFDFGLVDGKGFGENGAKFQHPLGLALVDLGEGPRLLVADTYNHALRLVDPKTGEVSTFVGDGEPKEGTPEEIGFFEPNGVDAVGDTAWIADTNHHRIVELNLKTKQARVLDVE